MRLGDLDDLKESIALMWGDNNHVTESMYEIIDNAPTVEPFEPDYVGAERLNARQRGYEEGYHNGLEIGKTLNPKIKQGEWIDTGSGQECNVCHEIQYGYDNFRNFCPNCGAKMKGGADNETN